MALSASDRAVRVAGVAAAVAFAVIANGIALRHYRRWDVTRTHTHTLAPATLDTLRGLDAPVDVWVLLGGAEPLSESVRHALEAYRGQTSQLVVHVVDPDRDPAAYEDVRRRFKLDAGRAEAGRAADNVALIVARGAKHWFIERGDLIEIESEADGRVRPREERALTSAIRAVLAGDKPRVCFTAGHGEPALGDFGPKGAGALADVLRKDNYDVDSVDLAAPDVRDPFTGCAAVVVASPRRPFPGAQGDQLRGYLRGGGRGFFALSPVATATGLATTGLEPVLADYGVALDDDLVVETDQHLAFQETRGTAFIANVRVHPVTASLVDPGPDRPAPPPIVLELVRSMHHASGPIAATDLLVTSDAAFGVTRVTEDMAWAETPTKGAADLSGPLAIAMAAERPATDGAKYGARVVVVGTSSVLTARGGDPTLMGSAFFAEGAISWLAARPPVLDIPDRPPVVAGIRLTAESRAEVKRYVLGFIPGTFFVLGALVLWSRRRPPRSGSGRDEGKRKQKASPRGS